MTVLAAGDENEPRLTGLAETVFAVSTARAAGVVGTFGIGAMANFGIADKLTVETESAINHERTICRAEKSRLSLKDDCIEREILPAKNEPGTTVTASVAADSHINVQQARN